MDYFSFADIKFESKIIYNNLEHLKNLEKMSFLGWYPKILDKEIISFVEFIIKNYKYLF